MFSSIMEAGKKQNVLTATGRSGHATASTGQTYALAQDVSSQRAACHWLMALTTLTTSRGRGEAHGYAQQ